MILKVEYSAFADAVKKHLPESPIYLSREIGRVIVSAADPNHDLMILSHTASPISTVRNQLQEHGLTTESGRWMSDAAEHDSEQAEIYVAAVAYRSSEAKPGLWVDIFPTKPTTSDVMQAFYEEFSLEGIGTNLTLDQFIKLCEPNIVVLDPTEISSFLAKKLVVPCE